MPCVIFPDASITSTMNTCLWFSASVVKNVPGRNMCLSQRLCILSMSVNTWPAAVNCLIERPSAEEVEEVLGSHSGSYQGVQKGHLITQANPGQSCAAFFSLSSGMPDARVLSWLPKQLISWKSLAFCQERKQLARITSETELVSICSQLKTRC